MLRKLYFGLVTVVLIAYSVSWLGGWELETTNRQTIPHSALQAPGGYRSFHFWRTGYQGGK